MRRRESGFGHGAAVSHRLQELALSVGRPRAFSPK